MNPFPKGNQDDVKSDAFRAAYELARAVGDKRFGSECKHEHTKNGVCTACLRKVVTK